MIHVLILSSNICVGKKLLIVIMESVAQCSLYPVEQCNAMQCTGQENGSSWHLVPLLALVGF